MNTKKKKLGIVNSDGMHCTYGGVAPFLRNMHEKLNETFELEYFVIPDSLRKFPGPGRLKMVLTLWHRRKDIRKCDFVLSHVPEGSYLVGHLGVPFAHVNHGNNNPMKCSRYRLSRLFYPLFEHFQKYIEKESALLYTVGEVSGRMKKLWNPLTQDTPSVPCETRRGLIFAGRLELVKNIDRLIEIYATLPEDFRKDNPFYIAGYGTLETSLRKSAEDSGAASDIIFLGNVPNEKMQQVDSDKRILVMASSHEGFPTAIAEALSVGVPVVSTDVGDISSIIKNNVNGFLLPPDFKNEDYATAIMNIMNEYERFSRAALESSRVFDKNRITESVINDFQEVLGSKK